RPCSNAPASGVATNPTAIAGWLRSLTSLQVSKPSSITIDGKAGQLLDIVVPRAPKALCGGTDAIVEFMISQPWNRTPDVTDVHTEGMGVGSKQRLILLDNGAGGVTAILIRAANTSGFDAFVNDAMPIAQSMQFR